MRPVRCPQTDAVVISMVFSLGPISKIVDNIPDNPQADGLGSNPRCLRRDVNKYAAAATTANLTYALITENHDINKFQTVMLGTPSKNDWGVHIGGHYTIGGDPGDVSARTLPCSSTTDVTRVGPFFFPRRPGVLLLPSRDD